MADPVHYAQLNLLTPRSQKPNLPSRVHPPGLYGSEGIREERTVLDPGGEGSHDQCWISPGGSGRCRKIQGVLFAALALTCLLFGITILYLTLNGSSCTCPADEGNVTQRLQEMRRKLSCVTEKIQDNVSLSAESRLCPENWIFQNEMCYYISDIEESREESHMFCMSHEAQLATVTPTQTGLLELVKEMRRDFWVGLMKERRDTYETALWYWSDNKTESQVRSDREDMTCAKLAEELTAEPCTSKLQWICEKKAEMNFYKIISDCL